MIKLTKDGDDNAKQQCNDNELFWFDLVWLMYFGLSLNERRVQKLN